MQKCLLTLLLAAACAGCAHHKAASTQTVALAPNEGPVEELANPSATSAGLAAVVPQFSRGAPPIMISQQPIYSMRHALLNVQRISPKPVVAMVEYKNWYWYATDVTRDPNTQAVQDFRSGYAVQKGGYLAWKW